MPAGIAHREILHRRARTVVGQRIDNREARPAIRAVDKRVPITPVLRIEQLCKAFVTGRQVGRDQRCFCNGRLVRKANLKRIESFERHLSHLDGFHLSSSGRFLGNSQHELINQVLVALRVDGHTVGRIEHPSVHQMPFCHPIHERPKPYALHDSVYMYAQCRKHDALSRAPYRSHGCTVVVQPA